MTKHNTPAVEISAKRDGFRRAGEAHTKDPKVWPAGHWSPGQLKALKAESMLVVREVEDPDKAAADKAAADKAAADKAAADKAAADKAAADKAAADKAAADKAAADKAAADKAAADKAAADKAAADKAAADKAAADQAAPMTVAEAIAKLDRANKEHWTNGGKPQVAALETILGRQISAADRDAAWETVSGSGE